MSTKTSITLERSDGRLMQRALIAHLGELMTVMPGGGSLDPRNRTMGQLACDLEGIGWALMCVGGCEAPDAVCQVPAETLYETSGWILEYGSRCMLHAQGAAERDQREDVVAYWKAEGAHAIALGKRLEAMA